MSRDVLELPWGVTIYASGDKQNPTLKADVFAIEEGQPPWAVFRLMPPTLARHVTNLHNNHLNNKEPSVA